MKHAKDIHIKCDSELFDLLKALAAQKHISMSDVIRLAVLEVAQREGVGAVLRGEEDARPVEPPSR